MVISFLGSILFLGNPLSPWQWLGMALMLGSLTLFVMAKHALDVHPVPQHALEEVSPHDHPRLGVADPDASHRPAAPFL